MKPSVRVRRPRGLAGAHGVRPTLRRAARLSVAPSRPRPRSRPGLRRRLAWFLGKILAIAILGAGAWTLLQALTDPRLQVSRTTVRGNELLTIGEILDTLSLDGANVFLLSGQRLARRLQIYPSIQHVRVEPFLPDRVRVTIFERPPAAVWDTGAQRVLLDVTGLGIRQVSRQAPTTLPVLEAPEGPFVQVGERVDPDAVRVAQAVAPRLDSLGLAGAHIEYRPSTGVSIMGTHRVALGSEEDLEAKLSAYRSIRQHLDQTRTAAELVDVRFLDRPYFR